MYEYEAMPLSFAFYILFHSIHTLHKPLGTWIIIHTVSYARLPLRSIRHASSIELCACVCVCTVFVCYYFERAAGLRHRTATHKPTNTLGMLSRTLRLMVNAREYTHTITFIRNLMRPLIRRKSIENLLIRCGQLSLTALICVAYACVCGCRGHVVESPSHVPSHTRKHGHFVFVYIFMNFNKSRQSEILID